MKRMIVFCRGDPYGPFRYRGNDSLVAQERYALKAPNGISFSEVRGYETWQVIAPSYRTDNKELRVILGNTVMINSYKKGIPGNGKPFPDGAIIVKIGWSERQSPVFPAAFEPDVLKRVEFIVKNAKRFPASSGWGYARFVYDEKTANVYALWKGRLLCAGMLSMSYPREGEGLHIYRVSPAIEPTGR